MTDPTAVLIVIAFFACLSFVVSLMAAKNTKIHYDMNQKYISSQIMIQMLKETKEYRKMNDRIILEDVKEYESDGQLGPYLNYLEYLGGYYRDELVKDYHIKNTYGVLLEKIKKDDLLERRFGDQMKSDHEIFENLQYLIKKIVPPNDSKKE